MQQKVGPHAARSAGLVGIDEPVQPVVVAPSPRIHLVLQRYLHSYQKQTRCQVESKAHTYIRAYTRTLLTLCAGSGDAAANGPRAETMAGLAMGGWNFGAAEMPMDWKASITGTSAATIGESTCTVTQIHRKQVRVARLVGEGSPALSHADRLRGCGGRGRGLQRGRPSGPAAAGRSSAQERCGVVRVGGDIGCWRRNSCS